MSAKKMVKRIRLISIEMDITDRQASTRLLASVAMTCPSCGGQVPPNVEHHCTLRGLGLVDDPQPGTVAARPVLFLEER